jgi:superkiller protein 8
LIHTFADAHPLGAHHVTVDVDNGGTTAASSGFGQELVVWDLLEGKEKLRSSPAIGEAWALSLSPDGKMLNTTTHDGRVILWDTSSLKKMAEIDTKGSFGTCIACVPFRLFKLI